MKWGNLGKSKPVDWKAVSKCRYYMYFNKAKQWYSPSYMYVCGCQYSLSNSIIERSIRIIIKSFQLFAEIWICKPWTLAVSRAAASLPGSKCCCRALKHFGIQWILLLLHIQYPTGYNGMQESLRLQRNAQNASVHSWPLSLSVALLPLSCASPFLPLPAGESL